MGSSSFSAYSVNNPTGYYQAMQHKPRSPLKHRIVKTGKSTKTVLVPKKKARK